MFTITLVIFVLRQYFKAAYYYLDEPGRGPAPPSSGIPNWENEPGPVAQETLNGGGGAAGTGAGAQAGARSKGPIHLDDFEGHVVRNHADSDAGFSREYTEIQRHSDKVARTTSHEHSSHPDNKCKNRYLNIVACKY